MFYFSQVLVNIHSIHMDPDVWRNPEKFDPERFLDSEGSVQNKEKVISFSLGEKQQLLLSKYNFNFIGFNYRDR